MHVSHISTSTHRPIINPLVSYQSPPNYHSFSLHPPLNKTATMNFLQYYFLSLIVMLFVGCFDKYVHRIGYLANKVVIILSKLSRILLSVAISMAKQLSYWCFGICNVIEYWILWNYSLDGHCNCLSPYWHMFDTIGYSKSYALSQVG